jgi:hypothetical protein
MLKKKMKCGGIIQILFGNNYFSFIIYKFYIINYKLNLKNML